MTFEKMLEAWVAFTRLNWEETEQRRRSREPEGVKCKVLKNVTREDGWGWRRGWRGEIEPDCIEKQGYGGAMIGNLDFVI